MTFQPANESRRAEATKTRRSQAAARRAVRHSGIPARCWAEVLGVHRRNIYKLLAGDPRVSEGPSMQNVQGLLDALTTKHARWEKLRVPGKPGRHTYRLTGWLPGIATRTTQRWHVDFATGHLTMDEARQAKLRKRLEAIRPWNEPPKPKPGQPQTVMDVFFPKR